MSDMDNIFAKRICRMLRCHVSSLTPEQAGEIKTLVDGLVGKDANASEAKPQSDGAGSRQGAES